MKALEIMEELFALADEGEYSVARDTCKSGNPEAEVNKVAVTMFATPDVIRQATKWGAQLLIVHEPTYHGQGDKPSDEKVDVEKRKLIEDSGITIYRFHDHPHYTTPDIIAAGQLKKLDLRGEIEYTDVFDLVRIHLEDELTPVELAKIIEDKCGIKHVRICGAADIPCRVVSGMFGAPGELALDELKNDKSEIVILGETCEWSVCEYVRDAAQFGYKKALLVMGHIGSERDGMRYTAELIKEKHPELEVEYFESEEVYTYTDSK